MMDTLEGCSLNEEDVNGSEGMRGGAADQRMKRVSLCACGVGPELPNLQGGAE
jgi:hypothetical protein